MIKKASLLIFYSKCLNFSSMYGIVEGTETTSISGYLKAESLPPNTAPVSILYVLLINLGSFTGVCP